MRTPETDPEKIKARKDKRKEYLHKYYSDHRGNCAGKMYNKFCNFHPDIKAEFIGLLSKNEYI